MPAAARVVSDTLTNRIFRTLEIGRTSPTHPLGYPNALDSPDGGESLAAPETPTSGKPVQVVICVVVEAVPTPGPAAPPIVVQVAPAPAPAPATAAAYARRQKCARCSAGRRSCFGINVYPKLPLSKQCNSLCTVAYTFAFLFALRLVCCAHRLRVGPVDSRDH